MTHLSGTETVERYVVHPVDTGMALENPGMGWVLHYYDNGLDCYGSKLAPADTLEDFPGITVIYLRLAWGYLEPEEGRYNWEIIDTPAQRWISRGKQIAFRFSCSEWDDQPATPAWVQAAGAKGYHYTPGKGIDPEGRYWEPDYNDPIFLEKHGNFLAAVAARYDGAPEVAFIDIGSFGIWGENHNFWSTKLDYDAETAKRHIDLYTRYFKRSLLIYNSPAADHGRGLSSLEYAQQLGLGFRDDSILVLKEEITPRRWERASGFWHHVPVILESQHYGMSVNDGCWGDGTGYLQAIEAYHASWVSIHWWPREFLVENGELIASINRRMGYRLQLLEASWPTRVHHNDIFSVATHWQNTGVAPCLPDGCITITLKDADGGIAAVFVDEHFHASSLPVDAMTATVHESNIRIPVRLAPGNYDLFLSIGGPTGSPRIALPYAESDGQRRYHLGTIMVEE